MPTERWHYVEQHLHDTQAETYMNLRSDQSGMDNRPLAEEMEVDGEKIAQGAEGVVYRVKFFGRSAIQKIRFPKLYRHPDLDRRLTSRRLVQEARALLRMRKEGLIVPSVYYVDCNQYTIIMEDMGGKTLRDYISTRVDPGDHELVMEEVGKVVAKMHRSEHIHGDLTTSNIIIRSFADESSLSKVQVCLIDFGLSSSNATDEDIAVDLYVFERAVLSTQPDEADALIASFMSTYNNTLGRSSVLRRLEDVRARGRKRDMTG